MKNNFQYLLFYKPFEVLCQFSKEENKKTFADFFPDIDKDIYPVGRLDYDSEGLILLTNDKAITHRLLHPKFQHHKTYLAQVEGVITDDALKQLAQGVTISVNGKSYKTRPAQALRIEEPQVPPRNPPIRFRKNIPTSWLQLTLTEGKNRQVRKMTAAAGFPTLRLIRSAIGAITIEGLKVGRYRPLSQEELPQLFA